MRLAFASLLAVASVAGAPVAAIADTIRLTDGKKIEGIVVVDETITGVVYKIHGSSQEEPADKVAEVVYETRPVGWDAAMAAFGRGDYARAAADFAQRLNARETWVKVYAAFHLAEAKRFLGDLAGASEVYRKFMADHASSRFYPKAKLGLGLVQIEQRDFAGAQKTFEELANEAKAKKLDKVAEQANFQLAATLEAQGNLKDALERYQKLATAAAQRGGVSLANVAVFRLQAQTDPSKVDAALSGLQGLIDGQNAARPDVALDFDLLAAAHTALGDIHDVKGDHQKALLAYLRVVVDPDLAKVTAERPHALWGAARSFEKTKGQDWRERAESLRRELRDSFPNSIWAKKG
jgi:tetratricopeptide (TPR) repeat protein